MQMICDRLMLFSEIGRLLADADGSGICIALSLLGIDGGLMYAAGIVYRILRFVLAA